jgi:hypothetical protein
VTLLAFAAPIFAIGVMGVIVGPALYGFVLAAYRTRLSMMEEVAGVARPEAKRGPTGPSGGPSRLGRKARGFVSWLTRGRL